MGDINRKITVSLPKQKLETLFRKIAKERRTGFKLQYYPKNKKKDFLKREEIITCLTVDWKKSVERTK
jgi:hypothetical protein